MFQAFSAAVHARFVEMSKRELYVVRVENLFEQYLAAFPAGADPIFRQRTVHDCQCCKQFVRRLGKLVNIVNGNVQTVWDVLDMPHPYREVAARMSGIVKAAPVQTVFRTKERKFGVDHNYDGKTNERYDHFYGEVADKHWNADPETKRGEQEAIFQVAKRGLSEIQSPHLDEVLDLIESNGLYRGEEHKPAVVGFKELLTKFNAAGKSDLFVWESLDNRNARFRNTVIGTLLVDLADGKDMDQAVKAFETKVAPMNYKRPTSVITQKMVEQAVQTLTDLGLGGAIYRRYARLSDVSVNDVLFVNNDTRARMKDGIAALLEGNVKKTAPNLDVATPVSADQFVKDVLTKAKTVEVFLKNHHAGNFVSLTGSDGPERLFKWDNAFAWSYDGDVTDSVKQRVKAAGGNVNAKLRVSLSWYNFDDLDLHAVTPDRKHVFFRDKMGILDVDMNAGRGQTRNAVENLAFNDLRDGTYAVHVHQYAQRETVDIGFSIEVEFAGVIHQFSYAPAVKQGKEVACFKLVVKGGKLVEVNPQEGLVGGSASQEKWGVKTETLVPVNSILYSPNHWGGSKAGQRHLIFALEGCKNPGATRGVFNEFLRGDLDRHRKVFEVLGSKTKCAFAEDQISGVGFTGGRNDSVTVVVDGRRAYALGF
ncbi:hypothetical protein [Limnoglobus roseus]|uniref:Uncharacterized protein n=1 Tax=Limnoglobus roseus TaxID=2598579 RepID=A0A5C1AFE9_9BACT|nr:hypothetical protein [Limnoglobus roseus]QEL16452.1 hypothetical protein PX52LOC_03406 [Limnoglobus roseus]